MIPKPKHLSTEYAAQFQDPSVVTAYPLRPPYPPEVFEVLAGLIVDGPRLVLDLGCGTGDIARRLAPTVERLDAVDIAGGMIEQGKRLPGGDDPHLNWIQAAVEEAPLAPPYDLITAGESLHWLDWEVIFPRFVEWLTPQGMLAIIGRDWDLREEVRERSRPLFLRYSTNREFRPYDLIEELELRGLFERQGETRTAAAPWRPTVDAYIECRHSQNGLSRDRMPPEQAAAFDAQLRAALHDLCERGIIEEQDGRLELEVAARVTWGRPRADAGAQVRDASDPQRSPN